MPPCSRRTITSRHPFGVSVERYGSMSMSMFHVHVDRLSREHHSCRYRDKRLDCTIHAIAER